MFGFPLLLIPLAICNIIVFLMPGVSFSAPLATVPLWSGVAWTVTLSDAVLAFSALMLMFEIIKGARPGGKYFTDHFLALLVFAGAAAEFVMLPQFGTSLFFLLALLALVDFLSGLALRGRRPRRVATVPALEAGPAAPVAVNREPSFAPAPAPAVPAVPETVAPPPASVAPVTQDLQADPLKANVEPIVPDATAADIKRETDSPKIVSPGLAPGGAAQPLPDSPRR